MGNGPPSQANLMDKRKTMRTTTPLLQLILARAALHVL
jgi:hypothetical protein